MDLQVRARSEALDALVTTVGLLPGVSPHVDLQGGAFTEAVQAIVTTVRLLPGVSLHVALQVRARTEALTLATPVGLLRGVTPPVDLQV